MRFNRIFITLAGAAFASAASAQLVIDNFTTAMPTMQLSSVGSTWNQVNGGGIAGGQRDASLAMSSNPFSIPNGLVCLTTGNGLSIVSADPGVTGALTLDYDGAGDPGSGDPTLAEGSGLGLNLSGYDRFRIGYSSADLPVNVTVTMYHFGDAVSTASTVLAAQSGVGSYSQDILFTSFSGTPNLSAIDRIEYTFDPYTAGDFVLNSLQAVPEPAPVAVLGLGALLVLRRRRKA